VVGLALGFWGELIMGLKFGLEDVNCVSYLASEENEPAPRATRSLLYEFFVHLADGYSPDNQGYLGVQGAGLLLGGRHRSIISSRGPWLSVVISTATMLANRRDDNG